MMASLQRCFCLWAAAARFSDAQLSVLGSGPVHQGISLSHSPLSFFLFPSVYFACSNISIFPGILANVLAASLLQHPQCSDPQTPWVSCGFVLWRESGIIRRTFSEKMQIPHPVTQTFLRWSDCVDFLYIVTIRQDLGVVCRWSY